jgi:uncharacterized protein YhbP (UPF0306 family)
MSPQLSSEIVWEEMSKELFAVLGMVTARGEARTTGVVYIVHDQKVYILTGEDTWKARHIQQNRRVSVTVPIPKRIPFLSWIKIPSATISFAGTASVIATKDIGDDIVHALMRGQESDTEKLETMCVIEILPVGDFITYGVGIPLMTMREPEKARGRVSISSG